jgi:hypothetical protein
MAPTIAMGSTNGQLFNNDNTGNFHLGNWGTVDNPVKLSFGLLGGGSTSYTYTEKASIDSAGSLLMQNAIFKKSRTSREMGAEPVINFLMLPPRISLNLLNRRTS